MRLAMLLWMVVVIISLAFKMDAIIGQNTNDPDDALRLVQVRDLLGGQGWWDISQHRINPLGGDGLMHWSRIVDAPLALGIAALTPLMGPAAAESVVIGLWPLILLAPLFWLVTRTGETLGNRPIALIAPVLLASNQLILLQFAPLRIDHHSWQIMLAGALLLLAIFPASRRTGMASGLVAATYLAISLEALPAIALFAAIMAAEWLWSGAAAARHRLVAYLVTLSLSACLLQWLTRGPVGFSATWCDSLSLPYLGALISAALLIGFGAPLVDKYLPNPFARVGLLGSAGLASGVVLLIIEPTCGHGPFGTLDPIVVEYWYLNIREGLPFWSTIDATTGFALAPSLVGMLATAWAAHVSVGAARRQWLIIFAAFMGMMILSLFVMRATAIAHLFAIAGTAYAAHRIWHRARAVANAGLRIMATLSVLAILPPTAGAAAGLAITAMNGGEDQAENPAGHACVDAPSIAGLNAIAPSLIFAPLEIGPHILQKTHHSVMATGHHRNNRVMASVISAFVGDSEAARDAIGNSGASLVVICTSAAEYDNFRRAPGNVFATQLATGQAPNWLTPLAMPTDAGLMVWRVERPN
ncbi:MAG: hypothetical protein ABL909_01990 [Sphingopyxis sp.]